MFKLALLVLLCMACLSLPAQDSVRYRIIFVGEETEPGDPFLEHSLSQSIPGRTLLLFLDENKFLSAESKPGSKEAQREGNRFREIVEVARAKNIPAFFIANPGWNPLLSADGHKPDKETRDSILKGNPSLPCPDPVELPVTDQLAIVVFNSAWWLEPYSVETQSDCECKTRGDVLAVLDELRYKNQNRHLIVVSAHPFNAFGDEGRKSTLKDHLFPLTSLNKNLYLPLPVAGSLYRFFKSGFAGPQNSRHPMYKDMVSSVDEVLKGSQNRIHVSAHAKGLQLVDEEYIQVISGSGANRKGVNKGSSSGFISPHPGYIIADLLADQSLRFRFYSKAGNFENSFNYTVPLKTAPDTVSLLSQVIKEDSVTVQVHPSYDKVNGFHKLFFGENYRKEWAAPTKLPVLRMSEIAGGLTPVKRGGGMQSKSLRLVDKQGREWALRSVEKSPDALLPENLRQTFAREWIDDATSAQHPFSALIVPPIAKALKVPHAVPVIGFVSPDTALGIHGRVFENTVALLEEREPLGDSDNSEKMKKNLKQDNDNKILAKEFLNARMLDVLVGDWDRHEDQWRWFDIAKGKTKHYLGIPRDRDQVFHVTQGLFPKLASRSYVLPTLRDFDKDISKIKWVLFKTRFVNAYPAFQFAEDEWMQQANEFKEKITDDVLEEAIRQLPQSAFDIRHKSLLETLKTRRDRIPAVMASYYRFIQKIADIQTSDKHEFIAITGESDGGLRVKISKISKSGEIEDELMNKAYEPSLTKEIRIYMHDGNDSVILNNGTSPIKLRLIGGNERKHFTVIESKRKTRIYNKDNGSLYAGNLSRIKKFISNDSLHTVFEPVNLYNVWMPIVVVGHNLDDGFIVGAGFKYTGQGGFRKTPYTTTQQLLARYAFSTGAYRIKYTGEWKKAIGNADLVINALARAPHNTTNFFGRGNETVFNKSGDYKRFYRTRFTTYQADPTLRWQVKKATLNLGPSLYYYQFDPDDNKGRFVENTSLIGSYDSATLEKSKLHLGGTIEYTRDLRNNRTFPQWGSYINIRIQAYKGMGDYARSFAQLIPEFAFYKSLTRRSTIVLAERLGGVVGLGDMAFYQSAFLGGHDNLWGYRQYRFAGQHSFYNNLELRVKLADVASYIVPGQFGISGFWDIGRVWEKHDNSGKWHNGGGGGIYFAPASVMVFSFVMGYSREGWYPYFTMGMRF